jgi:glutamate N-acetyltransferase / amino-acid N-acetyltransferase
MLAGWRCWRARPAAGTRWSRRPVSSVDRWRWADWRATNDTLAVLAGGSGQPSSRELRACGAALTDLLDDLAHQLIGDGDGVHHVVTIDVRGARNTRDAEVVARRIAISPLVKTAIAGGAPSWGRIRQ